MVVSLVPNGVVVLTFIPLMVVIDDSVVVLVNVADFIAVVFTTELVVIAGVVSGVVVGLKVVVGAQVVSLVVANVVVGGWCVMFLFEVVTEAVDASGVKFVVGAAITLKDVVIAILVGEADVGVVVVST